MTDSVPAAGLKTLWLAFGVASTAAGVWALIASGPKQFAGFAGVMGVLLGGSLLYRVTADVDWRGAGGFVVAILGASVVGFSAANVWSEGSTSPSDPGDTVTETSSVRGNSDVTPPSMTRSTASTNPASSSGSTSTEPQRKITITGGSYWELDDFQPSEKAMSDAEIHMLPNSSALLFGQTLRLWKDTRVVVVNDNDVSRQGCETGSKLQTGGRVDKSSVAQDESVCISTSGGNWVVLKSADGNFANDDPFARSAYEFKVQTFPR
jgi:hypothetical protein